MFESIVTYIAAMSIPVIWILLIALATTFTENIFPPAPCDTILLVLGGFIGLGKVDFVSMMIFSTIGSILGFALMYWLGREFGLRIIETGRFSFINHTSMEKPTEWFRKYGYLLIIGNRFLSGTRAVISFFAGVSGLSITKTIILSSISALIWNGLLLGMGMIFGNNWRLAQHYINLYGNIIMIILAAILIFFTVRYFIKKRPVADIAENENI